MLNKFKPYIFLLLVLFLPGCRRLLNWGRLNFDQACLVESSIDIIKCYIRSVNVYNQLVTLAIFDAMLLSKEVTDLAQSGPFPETSFFILGFAPGTDRRPLNSEPTNQFGWEVSLLANGQRLKPITLKCVDLPARYKFLFDDKWSQFKNGYFVTFDYKSGPDETVILCFNSLRKKSAIKWEFKDGRLLALNKECCFTQICDNC